MKTVLKHEPTFEELECKRKTRFPTVAMARNAADSLAKVENEEISHYFCNVCKGFHIGHTSSSRDRNGNEKIVPSRTHKFFVTHQGVTYAKIKDNLNNHYIFVVPDDIEEWENEVIAKGVLIAHRMDKDIYKDKDGKPSDDWKLYNTILPFYAKELVKFKIEIEKHLENMIDSQSAKMMVINKTPFATLEDRVPKKIYVRPDDSKSEVDEYVAKQEMYQGRNVHRTDENRPYFRDVVSCCNEGCEQKVELRSYISTDKKGKLGHVSTKIPADHRAMMRPGKGSRGPNAKWICGDCVSGGNIKVEETKDNLVVEHYDNDVLSDLERLATDQNVDADFVRGATLMACYLLKSQ